MRAVSASDFVRTSGPCATAVSAVENLNGLTTPDTAVAPVCDS
jgi:hypothetical protein